MTLYNRKWSYKVHKLFIYATAKNTNIRVMVAERGFKTGISESNYKSKSQ